MFQSLLSPIRSRFDLSPRNSANGNGSPASGDPTSPSQTLQSPQGLLSPRSPLALGFTSPGLSVFGPSSANTTGHTDLDEQMNAEEFARDVLVELMRGAVEEIRVRAAGGGSGASTEDIQAQVKVLSELHRIMQQDTASLSSAPSISDADEPRTKAVFREMDGFLCLMSVLSALSATPVASEPSPSESDGLVIITHPEEGNPTEECIRLVFLVIGESMDGCAANEAYFRTKVGWEVLGEALRGVFAEPYKRGVLSHLLAVSLNNFEESVTKYFIFDEDDNALDKVDDKVGLLKAQGEKNMKVRHSGAMRVLWKFVEEDDSRYSRYGLYKALEVLFTICHRNSGVLSSLGIVGDVFERFETARKALKVEEVPEDEKKVLEKEKQVLQRLLRKLLEMGATTAEARGIFKAAIARSDDGEKLDQEILDVIRFGMKSRWVEHFSLEGKAAVVLPDEQKGKTIPKDGISFLIWFFPSTLPTDANYALFISESKLLTMTPTVGQPQTRTHFRLSIRPDGRLSVYSSASPDEEAVFSTAPNAKVKRGRWTHVALVWYPKKGTNPNLRLYLDGAFVEGLHLAYPRTDSVSGTSTGIQYVIGDLSRRSNVSLSLASAYLLGMPLPDDIPRLIHHLGPRYTGSFQDPALVRFLTYEAATSLNMYLANASSLQLSTSSVRSPGVDQAPSPLIPSASVAGLPVPTHSNSTRLSPNPQLRQTTSSTPTPILKALREGMKAVGVKEESVLFGLAPVGFGWGVDSTGSAVETLADSPTSGRRRTLSGTWSEKDRPQRQKATLVGDVFVVKAESLDVALWKIGGAAVGLRLVELAETPHELSRTLGILTDGLKNNWQNSEDMERMRGYDILAAILRRKAHLINLTAFETIFEFLGLNFNVPEQSTIVNPAAYKAIALDFSLWARTGAGISPPLTVSISTSSTATTGTTTSTVAPAKPKPALKLTGYQKQVQRAHLDQFTTLLEKSRYRGFNWKVGFGEGSSKKDKEKKGSSGVTLVRRMLFALQMGWYGLEHPPTDGEDDEDMTQYLVDALGAALRAPGGFGKEDVKAMVSYLAANLHDSENVDGTSSNELVKAGDRSSLLVPFDDDHMGDGATTPQSAVSRHSFSFSFKELLVPTTREKAEKLLELLLQILATPAPSGPLQLSMNQQQSYYQKFMSALPLTRILLLLLGERPTPHVAALILRFIALGISRTPTFTRKFELVSGWSVLKAVLPSPKVWTAEVNIAAWDLLLGKNDNESIPASGAASPTSAGIRREKQRQKQKSTEVSCSHILPTIMSALQSGLIAVADRALLPDDATPSDYWGMEHTMEHLVEELLALHTQSATFRQMFESNQTTQLFADAHKAMVKKLTQVIANNGSDGQINGWNIRIMEKLTHFGLALALDNAVGGSQKREIMDNIQSAELLLHPGAAATMIDPKLVADHRSIRQRIASARFSMQIGDRTVIKTFTRMSDWRKTVIASEKKRFRKTVLDLREYRRQVSRLTEWTNLLTSERGLWPRHEVILWRLDETEGPQRIRKKLEPQADNSPSSRVDGIEETIRAVRPPESEAVSMIQVEVPPWAESYEISATETDDRQHLAEEIVDDKLRRVRHELEPGDVIEAVATVARIDGVDSSPGLLILGRTHIYMLDGVVENEEGEVIDAHDAPKRLLFIPGSIVELDGPQKAQRWVHGQIATCSDKKFLFRDVALEIYFRDSRSLLIVFLDSKKRTEFEARLSSIMGRAHTDFVMTPGIPTQRTPLFGKMSSRMLPGFKNDELSTATRRWQAREISNFAYLSILNQISGRTPSDATQYPVFPWVISDYTSQILDLNNSTTYRDLTKPMGALTPARRQAAETRYANLQSVGEEPFHYGTHFSSSMIVCHFLIRLAPFTNMFKTLQGGDWDLPDRLFSDLPRAYESAAHDVRGDVRELIPEFYTCPEFLENAANHDFGVLQTTGEKIHDVKLPPWARQDPLLFITLNRKALESTIVSEQLPAWIDLIWGCKQREAESLNAFHPLSYEGSIDLDSIKDDLEREATVGIIHNFGQTPRKIFNAPHPERYHHGLHTLPIGTLHGIEEDPQLLAQKDRCFKDLGPGTAIHDLVPDYIGEKMIPCPEGTLCLPQFPHEHIEWRTGSTELRVSSDSKVIQVIENAFCTCAAFADSSSLVTGSSDYTVRLWKVSRGQFQGMAGTGMRLALSHIMRVHTDEVVSVTASRAWSLVVSGSKDGSAALWDLNRGIYVRSIWHGEACESTAVNIVAINESTGYIATCSRIKLCLHTVNARPIATLDLTTTPSFSRVVPTITSMAFHEREYSHLGVLATGGPDGSITLRTWTADGTPEGEKAQWEFLTIRTMKVKMLGHGRPPSVTALRFLGESLYHGEETGKSYVWALPDS